MGSNKTSYWTSIIDRIKGRIVAWKVRWLSLLGKILLIKSILASILNYYLAILKAPTLVILQIQKLIRGFLWMGNLSDDKKIPLISLQDMTHTPIVRGVGVHDL